MDDDDGIVTSFHFMIFLFDGLQNAKPATENYKRIDTLHILIDVSVKEFPFCLQN